jgi:hypothetical protein
LRGEADVTRFIGSAMNGANGTATPTHRPLAFSRRKVLKRVGTLTKFVAEMSDQLRTPGVWLISGPYRPGVEALTLKVKRPSGGA